MAEIEGRRLTTFEVAPDGQCCRLNFTDSAGQPSALTLPADCLNELLMTLPRMIAQSLRARCQDSSLRLVFPAVEWRLETGGGDRRVILTIGTGGGFEASFVFERAHLCSIASQLKDEEAVEAIVRSRLN